MNQKCLSPRDEKSPLPPFSKGGLKSPFGKGGFRGIWFPRKSLRLSNYLFERIFVSACATHASHGFGRSLGTCMARSQAGAWEPECFSPKLAVHRPILDGFGDVGGADGALPF
jgi:hypothetical protein